MGLSKKTTIRYSESEISDIRTLLENKKLTLTSLRFLTSGIFLPLPFNTWRALIDNLPETHWHPIIESEKKIINYSKSLEEFLNLTKAWCMHVKKTPRTEHYFADIEKYNNKLEYVWHHNVGLTNNNWSRIFYSAILECDHLKDWNVIDNSLGIGQLSIMFEKR